MFDAIASEWAVQVWFIISYTIITVVALICAQIRWYEKFKDTK